MSREAGEAELLGGGSESGSQGSGAHQGQAVALRRVLAEWSGLEMRVTKYLAQAWPVVSGFFFPR